MNVTSYPRHFLRGLSEWKLRWRILDRAPF